MKSLAIGIAALSVVASGAAPCQQNKKDIVKSTHSFKGSLVGFETGDYVHAIIKDAKGHERTFFIGGAGLDYYMAVNAKKPGTFTYQVVDSYIEEAGGRMVIERLTKAKIGKVDSKAWWKAQMKGSSWEKLSKKYEPLVSKLTRNGG